LAFLLVHIVVASFHISYQSITVDEPDYHGYAVNWVQGKVERSDKMYDSKTPLMAVSVLPRIAKQLRQPGYKATDWGYSDIKNGRYLMVIYTIIIALYLFVWIRRLFGAKAWILPMLFFLFDPMVISFSMIITSDMASGACLIATMYHLWRFYQTRRWRDFLLFSFWLGIGFVCKASLLFMLPCLLLLYVILLIAEKTKFNFKKLILYGIVMSLISLFVLNAASFGKESFHSLNKIHFESKAFNSLASNQVINHIPIPVPENFIVALDLLQYHKEIGAGTSESSYPGIFVNGKTKYQDGFWYYYLYVGFYKIPVAILLLLVAGLITLVVTFKRKTFFEKHIWYALPAAFFFIVLSCFNNFQLGLRHLLLIYPLLFLGIAGVINYWQRKFRYTTLGGWLLFGWMIVSTTIYFPNLIPYTNEFLTDKKNVFRKIKDASIDYGQNTEDVQPYLKNHPDAKVPGTIPLPGKYIVRAMELFDEHSTNTQYLWLLNFKPVAHYKYSMFIFDISEKDMQQLKLSSHD
jgi:hypothetical protein